MNDSCCQSQIDVGALEERQRRVLVVVLVINAVTFIMMITAAAFSAHVSVDVQAGPEGIGPPEGQLRTRPFAFATSVIADAPLDIDGWPGLSGSRVPKAQEACLGASCGSRKV